MAAVLPASFVLGTVYLLVYIAGLSTVLLLIALLGQRFIGNITWAADPNGWFKRSLGVLFLLVGIAIFTGLDKQVEALILDTGLNTVQFENSLLDYYLTIKAENGPRAFGGIKEEIEQILIDLDLEIKK